ncbi:hypothetical protein Franean1_1002 [Parafrankia sp. EAN1pec]|nr:hypothetical protein Franean1_1002 [Frankia sp. EAN1pec]
MAQTTRFEGAPRPSAARWRSGRTRPSGKVGEDSEVPRIRLSAISRDPHLMKEADPPNSAGAAIRQKVQHPDNPAEQESRPTTPLAHQDQPK